MKQAILDIVIYCDANGQDATEAVRDYFAEKDSYITRAEAGRLVARTRKSIGEGAKENDSYSADQ